MNTWAAGHKAIGSIDRDREEIDSPEKSEAARSIRAEVLHRIAVGRPIRAQRIA